MRVKVKQQIPEWEWKNDCLNISRIWSSIHVLKKCYSKISNLKKQNPLNTKRQLIQGWIVYT